MHKQRTIKIDICIKAEKKQIREQNELLVLNKRSVKDNF